MRKAPKHNQRCTKYFKPPLISALDTPYIHRGYIT